MLGNMLLNLADLAGKMLQDIYIKIFLLVCSVFIVQ